MSSRFVLLLGPVVWTMLAVPCHGEPIRLSTSSRATIGAPPFAYERGDVVELSTTTGAVRQVFDHRSFANAENLDALHVLRDGRLVLSTAADAFIGSPALAMRDGDLVVYDPVADTAERLLDERAHFTGDVDVDAVFVAPDGTILLSTDDTATLGGLTFADGDVVAYDRTTRTARIVFSEALFGSDEDVDALHVRPDGAFVLSVKRANGAVLGGLPFRDGDLVAYDPVRQTAVLVLAEEVFGDDENVDAIDLGCGNGVVEADEECDRGSASPVCGSSCAYELCRAAPATGCRAPMLPQKASLKVKHGRTDAGDQLAWTWAKGAATTRADFGDPTTTDAYALCVYDESGPAPTAVLRAGAPAGQLCGRRRPRPCWKATRRGFAYANTELIPEGLAGLTLQAGEAGKAKVTVNARGPLFGLPALPLGVPFRVQVQGPDGACWEAHYSAAKKNAGARLEARSD